MTDVFLMQRGSEAMRGSGLKVISTLPVSRHSQRAAGGVQKIL